MLEISKVKDDNKIIIDIPYEEILYEVHAVHLSIGHDRVNKLVKAYNN